MPAIEMVGYHNLLPGPLLIHNNGHSGTYIFISVVITFIDLMIVYLVSMTVPKDALKKHERLPYIFGGKLHEEYEIEGLHFHWGDKNNRGSEHLVNDIRYPMEMHIIHRNTRYATVPDALKHEDGLCVLGFFYQISEHESDVLTNIVRNISSIEDYNNTVLLNSTFSLSSLLGDIDTDRFYMYRGMNLLGPTK